MKKRKDKKHEWLCRELLACQYAYTVVMSEKQFHKILKEYEVPVAQYGVFMNEGANATTHFLDHPEYASIAIVTVSEKHKSLDVLQVYALLVHEAVHIWQRSRRRIGEHSPGDETEAYAIQRISQSLMFEYERLTKGDKHAKKK